VIDLELATDLRDAGLAWTPGVHDRFAIPGHDLDDRVFALNDMSTEIRRFGDESAIMFNGAVEWSLDWIMREKVVWLPTEAQLRAALGRRFVSLSRAGAAYVCRAESREGLSEFTGASAEEAYALALLDLLRAQSTA